MGVGEPTIDPLDEVDHVVDTVSLGDDLADSVGLAAGRRGIREQLDQVGGEPVGLAAWQMPVVGETDGTGLFQVVLGDDAEIARPAEGDGGGGASQGLQGGGGCGHRHACGVEDQRDIGARAHGHGGTCAL